MLRTTRVGFALAMTAVLLFGACTSSATQSPAPATPAPVATPTPAAPSAAAPSPTEAPATPAPSPSAVSFQGCEVSDTGGIDDKGFNANAWKGLQDAQAQLGIKADFLESKAAPDYERNINTFIAKPCDLIVTVGFLLGDATKAAAEANANQKFAIVDFSYDPTIPNILGLTFQTDEAAMLAGYLAAGMTKTGKIGTFGGINIPPVTIFMDGLAAGVNYYNKINGKSVQLLGWTPGAAGKQGTGTFTGDFEDKDKGKQVAASEIQEGADIIVPVAGPVGLGAFAAVQDAKVMAIGVDVDQALSAPEYQSILLTSIMKRIDSAVLAATKQALDGTFKGGIYTGTLKNDGVGLAPYHDFDSKVPADLKTAVDDLKAKIISGEVKVSDYLQPAK